jgi:hypothetical protein
MEWQHRLNYDKKLYAIKNYRTIAVTKINLLQSHQDIRIRENGESGERCIRRFKKQELNST